MKYRLQPLGNKREEMFSGREGPEAVPPSSMSSSAKHCSVQKERTPALSLPSGSQPLGPFLFLFFSIQCSSTTRPAADSSIQRWRGRLSRTPANTTRESIKPVQHQRFSPEKPISQKAPPLPSRHQGPSYFCKLWLVLILTTEANSPPSPRPPPQKKWYLAASGKRRSG